MVRFIFVCMTVTALSLLSVAGQHMLNGVNEARTMIVERNQEVPSIQRVAQTPDENPNFSAGAMNNLETAAGDMTAGDTFGESFTGNAPKGLEDEMAGPYPAEISAYGN